MKDNKDQYIPGVHNYCDSWCERCAFTARCKVYVMMHEFGKDPYTQREQKPIEEMTDEEFDQKVAELRDMIRQIEESIEELEAEDEYIDPIEEIREQEAFDRTMQYANSVDRFFERNRATFERLEADYHAKSEQGAPVDIESLSFLKNAIENIRWYQFFSGVKLQRALSGLDEMDEFGDPLQSDANGSAKISMIAIRRSIDAWHFVAEVFPHLRHAVRKILELLTDMRAQLERHFPDWEKFHRPGFDDDPQAILSLEFNQN